jgi:hypothetical protein
MNEKKDLDGQCAAALRSIGMNLDSLAMEIILTLTDKVRHNRNEGNPTSLEEILAIKVEIEAANKPVAPAPGMPGAPPMQRVQGQ